MFDSGKKYNVRHYILYYEQKHSHSTFDYDHFNILIFRGKSTFCQVDNL